MHTTQFTLTPCKPFDFVSTIESHGWMNLTPFSWDADSGILSRPERVSDKVVEMQIRGSAVREQPAHVQVTVIHEGELDGTTIESLRARVFRSLMLGVDLTAFHRVCRRTPGLQNAPAHARGRLLLGSTLFEDIVKTILTTNVNWAGTKRMVNRLVDAFGSPLPWDARRRAFPTAEQIADGAEQILEEGLGLGYRASYIVDLARQICDGSLDLSRFENAGLNSDQLYRELRAIKGIGDYAASSILLFLGHAKRIPVDSWARSLISTHFHAGEKVTNEQAAGAFGEFGRWRALAFWFYEWPA